MGWSAERFARSFGYALEGIATLARRERNFRIHLVAAAFALGLAFVLRLPPVEVGLIALTASVVLAAEALNSALEALADVVSPRQHPLVKQAKDMAAAGVLLAALGAVVVALAIYAPRVTALLFG